MDHHGRGDAAPAFGEVAAGAALVTDAGSGAIADAAKPVAPAVRRGSFDGGKRVADGVDLGHGDFHGDGLFDDQFGRAIERPGCRWQQGATSEHLYLAEGGGRGLPRAAAGLMSAPQ